MNRNPTWNQLRTLKLAGMADMLGERLAKAATGKLGHAELLGCSAATRSPRPCTPGCAAGAAQRC